MHPKSAIIGEDFKVETFNVQMRENQSLVSLPIFILQDSVPEFDETFSIELLPNKIFGGATIGVRSKCEVVILENDYPYGKIGKLVLIFTILGIFIKENVKCKYASVTKL